MPYYKEPNGDYLYCRPKPYRLGMYEGRATAIEGLVSSVCTTGISSEFLVGCKKVRKRDVPQEWLEAIGA